LDVSRRLVGAGIRCSHPCRVKPDPPPNRAGVARSRTRLLTGWKSDAMFSVYADHQDKIAQSPLHDLYRKP
jgi:hypothetical protein